MPPTMMPALLPIFALATTQPPAAQARLAEAIADADSVDAVRVDRSHHTVTFAIDRAGEAYEIVARVAQDGEVASLTIRDRGLRHIGLGPMSWLADVMGRTHAVVRLEVGAAGQVTLVTDDGARYLAAPSRDGNRAVRARWRAAWDA